MVLLKKSQEELRNGDILLKSVFLFDAQIINNNRLSMNRQNEMSRVAIFAHFDPQGVIDDYVVSYLEEIRKECQTIFFISDGEIKKDELKKINHLITDSLCKTHGEYDFGSYKKGFFLLKENYRDYFNQSDEIVFLNDSCYCVGSFAESFAKAAAVKCDAWSVGYDYSGSHYYLQSYFFVLRKSAFTQNYVESFFRNITRQKSKDLIIKNYEMGLSKILLDNKCQLFSCYSSDEINMFASQNKERINCDLKEIFVNFPQFSLKKVSGDIFDESKLNYVHSNKFFLLLSMGFPLIKRAIIDSSIIIFDDQKLIFFWKEILRFKGMDKQCSTILSHLNKIGKADKNPNMLYSVARKIKFRLFKMMRKDFLFMCKKTKKGALVVKVLKIPVFYVRNFDKRKEFKSDKGNYA